MQRLQTRAPRLILTAILVGAACQAQPAPARPTPARPTPARPTFEVTSVKLNPNCRSGGIPGGTSPGRLALTCIPLRALIRGAFGSFTGTEISARKTAILGGPAWLDTEFFDISAKAEATATTAQMMGPMLQTLLEDRFNLKLHRESRETAVYALTVAKPNANLRPSTPDSCIPIDLENLKRTLPQKGEVEPNYCGFGTTRVVDGKVISVWKGVTMPQFAGRMLPVYADRPVVDKTELAGRWDVHLEFTRDFALAGPTRLNDEIQPTPATPADPTGPSIFTALQQQLGLKLVPAKAPVEVIVIDHAEKPTDN